jgi:ATP-dependent protease HslVU (ClpYQ) ATPase subunit
MQRYFQKKAMVQSKIDDETVMMDINSGFYFGLNAIASVIWELLKEEHTLDQLVDKLMMEYEVSREQCLKETAQLLQQMLEHKVIDYLED